ncbi:MAG: hypothetical protein RXR82_07475 [Nitrososphaeria archaeon]
MSIDWKRYDALLRSDDPRQRREALRELITQGINQLSEAQIREAARKRLNLLYELIVRAHLRDRIVGRAVALAMAGVLQRAWPDVEHVLMHPREIVDAMGEKGRIFREDPEAAEWLNRNLEDIYLFLKVLTWDVRCSYCGQRINYDDLFVKKKVISARDNRIHIYLMHAQCAVEEMRKYEEFRRYLEERVARAPPARRRRPGPRPARRRSRGGRAGSGGGCARPRTRSRTSSRRRCSRCTRPPPRRSLPRRRSPRGRRAPSE